MTNATGIVQSDPLQHFREFKTRISREKQQEHEQNCRDAASDARLSSALRICADPYSWSRMDEDESTSEQLRAARDQVAAGDLAGREEWCRVTVQQWAGLVELLGEKKQLSSWLGLEPAAVAAHGGLGVLQKRGALGERNAHFFALAGTLLLKHLAQGIRSGDGADVVVSESARESARALLLGMCVEVPRVMVGLHTFVSAAQVTLSMALANSVEVNKPVEVPSVEKQNALSWVKRLDPSEWISVKDAELYVPPNTFRDWARKGASSGSDCHLYGKQRTPQIRASALALDIRIWKPKHGQETVQERSSKRFDVSRG